MHTLPPIFSPKLTTKLMLFVLILNISMILEQLLCKTAVRAVQSGFSSLRVMDFVKMA